MELTTNELMNYLRAAAAIVGSKPEDWDDLLRILAERGNHEWIVYREPLSRERMK